MRYNITHKITIFAEEDTDFDLFEQESFRIGGDLGLEIGYTGATPTSLPTVTAEGESVESLKLLYRRLMAFFYG